MTVAAEQIAHTATTQWQRWSTSMQIVVTDPDSLVVARREVDAELDVIDAAASRFRPDSEINALAASAGRPTQVSEVLTEMVDAALSAARLTDGDVDPTIGAALIALGYDRDFGALDHTQPLATSMTIPATWSMVGAGWSNCQRGARGCARSRSDGEGGRCRSLRERVHHATGCGVLINLGGDITTAGPAPEGGWQVLVHDDDDDPASTVALPR